MLILFACAACKPKEQTQKEVVADSVNSVVDSSMADTTKAKILSFNHIDETRDKLSAIGIGKMSEWKEDTTGGFTSMTPEFELGEKKLNNIAFVLEGFNKNYINSFQIILKVGDPKEQRQGIAKLKDIATKAFETLDIQMPSMLPNAILNGKAVNVDGVDYGTSLKIDSAKVETWTVRVTTRTLP